jgi:hypothetical protein
VRLRESLTLPVIHWGRKSHSFDGIHPRNNSKRSVLCRTKYIELLVCYGFEQQPRRTAHTRTRTKSTGTMAQEQVGGSRGDGVAATVTAVIARAQHQGITSRRVKHDILYDVVTFGTILRILVPRCSIRTLTNRETLL